MENEETMTFNQVVRGSNPRCLITVINGNSRKSRVPIVCAFKSILITPVTALEK